MAEGTTIKVGIDASDVRKGLDQTEKKFAGFSKNIGSGFKAAAIGVGALVTGLAAAASSADDLFKDLAGYTGELEDMSTQTGMSMKDLLKFQRAFELAGVPISDASKLMSKFKENMQEASEGETPWRNSLNELGIYMSEIKGMEFPDVFDKVLAAAQLYSAEVESGARETDKLESIMSGLYGAKMGLPLIRLVKDYKNITQQAAEDTGELGDELQKNAANIGAMDDELNKFDYRRRQMQLSVFGNAISQQGDAKKLGSEMLNMADALKNQTVGAAANKSIDVFRMGQNPTLENFSKIFPVPDLFSKFLNLDSNDSIPAGVAAPRPESGWNFGFKGLENIMKEQTIQSRESNGLLGKILKATGTKFGK